MDKNTWNTTKCMKICKNYINLWNNGAHHMRSFGWRLTSLSYPKAAGHSKTPERLQYGSQYVSGQDDMYNINRKWLMIAAAVNTTQWRTCFWKVINKKCVAYMLHKYIGDTPLTVENIQRGWKVAHIMFSL